MVISRKKALDICHGRRLKNAWSIDYDYTHKLCDNDLEFLMSFTEFFYHGNPHKCGENFEINTAMKLESYQRNNAATRDIFTRTEVVILSLEELKNDYVVDYTSEPDIDR